MRSAVGPASGAGVAKNTIWMAVLPPIATVAEVDTIFNGEARYEG